MLYYRIITCQNLEFDHGYMAILHPQNDNMNFNNYKARIQFDLGKIELS